MITIPMKMICGDCKEDKPESEFYTEPEAPNGRCWYCKPCKRARTNAYRAAKREQYNAGNRRSYRMRKMQKLIKTHGLAHAQKVMKYDLS